MTLRDSGSRGDAIQKLNRICLKYIEVSNNSKKSRKCMTRRLESGKGLGYEFGEPSSVKRDDGFIRGSQGIGCFILHLPTSFVPVKEKLRRSLLFNSHVKETESSILAE